MFSLGLATAVYRDMKKINANILAKECGVSRVFITLIEAGHRLPPLNNKFIEAVAEFLEVPKASVLTSITCEHYLASMKDLAWFPPLFCKAISTRFVRDYLDEEEDENKSNVVNVNVLSPADHFRAPLLQEILSRLHPIAGDFYRSAKDVTIIDKKLPAIGVFKNAKPYLYKSESLFSLRDSLIFIDAFGLYEDQFHFSWHSPFTKAFGEDYQIEEVFISPYKSDPISSIQFPITTTEF